MNSYYTLLKHPNWQKKRLEIFERDGFQCRLCGDKNEQLSVHHWWYSKDRSPWEYDNSCFVTLCNYCHKNAPEINGHWGDGHERYSSVIEYILDYINPLNVHLCYAISMIGKAFEGCDDKESAIFLHEIRNFTEKLKNKKYKQKHKTHTHTQGSLTSEIAP